MKWALFTVSLIVYSSTCLPGFIEIGLYLTDTQQKKQVGTCFETWFILCLASVAYKTTKNIVGFDFSWWENIIVPPPIVECQ